MIWNWKAQEASQLNPHATGAWDRAMPLLLMGLTTLSPSSWFPAALHSVCFPYLVYLPTWFMPSRFSFVNQGITYNEMYRSYMFCSINFENCKHMWIYPSEQDIETQRDSSCPFTIYLSILRGKYKSVTTD